MDGRGIPGSILNNLKKTTSVPSLPGGDGVELALGERKGEIMKSMKAATGALAALVILAHTTVHVPVAGNTNVLVLIFAVVWSLVILAAIVLFRLVLRELGLTRVQIAGHNYRNNGKHRRH
jgi:hypothetical protein